MKETVVASSVSTNTTDKIENEITENKNEKRQKKIDENSSSSSSSTNGNTNIDIHKNGKKCKKNGHDKKDTNDTENVNGDKAQKEDITFNPSPLSLPIPNAIPNSDENNKNSNILLPLAAAIIVTQSVASDTSNPKADIPLTLAPSKNDVKKSKKRKVVEDKSNDEKVDVDKTVKETKNDSDSDASDTEKMGHENGGGGGSSSSNSSGSSSSSNNKKVAASNRKERVAVPSTYPRKKRVNKVVDTNPDKRERKIAMGPVLDETVYEFTFRMLLKYLELHGNMLVPCTFAVPWIDSWPQEMWGKTLGQTVQRIRAGTVFKEKKPELLAAGFQYDNQRLNHGWDTIRICLETFKTLNGNLEVPQRLVIPRTTQWLEDHWGIHIGKITDNIRYKGSYKENHEELKAMGFRFKE